MRLAELRYITDSNQPGCSPVGVTGTETDVAAWIPWQTNSGLLLNVCLYGVDLDFMPEPSVQKQSVL